MKKRIMSLLALVLLLSLIPTPAYATSDEATTSANALYQLGLFNGTGKDAQGNPIFQLDREPTRNEAVTMLVRLLGKEDEAKSKEWSTPFTDLDSWAKPYVGYAYNNGLTTGTSGTTFGGNGAVTPSQYITFVLRALGYKDGTDFQWNKAWELSDKLGFTKGQYTQWGVQEITVSGNTTSTTSRLFLRGDVAIISYNALSMKLKGTNTTLLENVKGSTPNVGEHTHNYIEQTVPATGHYEQVQVGTEQVQVGTEKRQYSKCTVCGAIAYTNEEMYGHRDHESPYFSPNCAFGSNLIYTEYVPVYEEKPVYENKWVEDTPATTIRICSICGQQEP